MLIYFLQHVQSLLDGGGDNILLNREVAQNGCQSIMSTADKPVSLWRTLSDGDQEHMNASGYGPVSIPIHTSDFQYNSESCHHSYECSGAGFWKWTDIRLQGTCGQLCGGVS